MRPEDTLDGLDGVPLDDPGGDVRLIVGPLLRYVGTTTATVWVETDAPAVVEVLGHEAQHLSGARASLRARRGRETSSPDRSIPTRCACTAGRSGRRWTAGPARRFTRERESARRGSSSARAGSVRRRGRLTRSRRRTIRTASASMRSGRTRASFKSGAVEWPDGLLLLGDQVYADEVPPETAAFIRSRETSTIRRVSRSPTSRSTRSCFASRGPIPTSAGCSRPCRRR